jgi:hypothetical protein
MPMGEGPVSGYGAPKRRAARAWAACSLFASAKLEWTKIARVT